MKISLPMKNNSCLPIKFPRLLENSLEKVWKIMNFPYDLGLKYEKFIKLEKSKGYWGFYRKILL